MYTYRRLQLFADQDVLDKDDRDLKPEGQQMDLDEPHSHEKVIKRITLSVASLLLIANTILLICLGVWLNTVLREVTSVHKSIYYVADMSEARVKGSHQFGRNFQYQSLDHRYDSLWDPELDEFNGEIALPELGTDQYGSITMFHQLHCLSAMRKALQRAGEGQNIGIDGHDDSHWPHCLDYLRAAILCNADGVIERPLDAKGNAAPTISGAFDMRQCGKAEKLYQLRSTLGVMKNPPSFDAQTA